MAPVVTRPLPNLPPSSPFLPFSSPSPSSSSPSAAAQVFHTTGARWSVSTSAPSNGTSRVLPAMAPRRKNRASEEPFPGTAATGTDLHTGEFSRQSPFRCELQKGLQEDALALKEEHQKQMAGIIQDLQAGSRKISSPLGHWHPIPRMGHSPTRAAEGAQLGSRFLGQGPERLRRPNGVSHNPQKGDPGSFVQSPLHYLHNAGAFENGRLNLKPPAVIDRELPWKSRSCFEKKELQTADLLERHGLNLNQLVPDPEAERYTTEHRSIGSSSWKRGLLADEEDWSFRERRAVEFFEYAGENDEHLLGDWFQKMEKVFELQMVPEKEKVSFSLAFLRDMADEWFTRSFSLVQRARLDWDSFKEHLRGRFIVPLADKQELAGGGAAHPEKSLRSDVEDPATQSHACIGSSLEEKHDAKPEVKLHGQEEQALTLMVTAQQAPVEKLSPWISQGFAEEVSSSFVQELSTSGDASTAAKRFNVACSYGDSSRTCCEVRRSRGAHQLHAFLPGCFWVDKLAERLQALLECEDTVSSSSRDLLVAQAGISPEMEWPWFLKPENTGFMRICWDRGKPRFRIFGMGKKLQGVTSGGMEPELKALLEESMSCKPSFSIWRTLLAAACVWKNLELGRVAFQEMLKMERQNGAAYVLWEQVRKLEEELKLAQGGEPSKLDVEEAIQKLRVEVRAGNLELDEVSPSPSRVILLAFEDHLKESDERHEQEKQALEETLRANEEAEMNERHKRQAREKLIESQMAAMHKEISRLTSLLNSLSVEKDRRVSAQEDTLKLSAPVKDETVSHRVVKLKLKKLESFFSRLREGLVRELSENKNEFLSNLERDIGRLSVIFNLKKELPRPDDAEQFEAMRKQLEGLDRGHSWNSGSGFFESQLLLTTSPGRKEWKDDHHAEECNRVHEMRTWCEPSRRPGESWWSDESGRIHRFTVGDCRHRQSGEIEKVLGDLLDDEKESAMCGHSKRLAIGCALLNWPLRSTIRVVKSLRICDATQ